MHGIFLFRDERGRLPTAAQLRELGFVVSQAVQPAEAGEARVEETRALAAEPIPVYGAPPVKPPGRW
jgi:hypothetical protein